MSAIDITKVRTTAGGQAVRGLRRVTCSMDFPIRGEMSENGGPWIEDEWADNGAYILDFGCEYDLRESSSVAAPHQVTNSCPHTTASPDGVCDECRGTVAAEPAAPRMVYLDGTPLYCTGDKVRVRASGAVGIVNVPYNRKSIWVAFGDEYMTYSEDELEHVTTPQPQKPKAITRYEVWIDHSEMRPEPHGSYVLYADHVAALTHRDAADVEPMIRQRLAEAVAKALDGTGPMEPFFRVADAILAKFHIAKKG